MPDLAPTDESFLTSAKSRQVGVFDIPRPAAEVWGELTRDGTLEWCRALSHVEWTSPRPFGVGTTRRLRALGLVHINERYIVWEEGRRKAFVVASTNLPLFRRFAEDYVVEPVTGSSCRFTWTIADEPTALGRPGAPLNNLLTQSLFADTRKYFGAA